MKYVLIFLGALLISCFVAAALEDNVAFSKVFSDGPPAQTITIDRAPSPPNRPGYEGCMCKPAPMLNFERYHHRTPARWQLEILIKRLKSETERLREANERLAQ